MLLKAKYINSETQLENILTNLLFPCYSLFPFFFLLFQCFDNLSIQISSIHLPTSWGRCDFSVEFISICKKSTLSLVLLFGIWTWFCILCLCYSKRAKYRNEKWIFFSEINISIGLNKTKYRWELIWYLLPLPSKRAIKMKKNRKS